MALSHCSPASLHVQFGLLVTFLSPSLSFPPDVFNPLNQFQKEGDINLGAILSIHKPVKAYVDQAHDSFRQPTPRKAVQFSPRQRERHASKRQTDFMDEDNEEEEEKEDSKNGQTQKDKRIRDPRGNYGSMENTAHAPTMKPLRMAENGKTKVDRDSESLNSEDGVSLPGNKNAYKTDGLSPKGTNKATPAIEIPRARQTGRRKGSSRAENLVQNADFTSNTSAEEVAELSQQNDVSVDDNSSSTINYSHTLEPKAVSIFSTPTPLSQNTINDTDDYSNCSTQSDRRDNVEDTSHGDGQKEAKGKIYNSGASAHGWDTHQTRYTEKICSEFIANFQAFENAVAILFALEEINNRTDLLPNTTLGITILDDCFTESLALARALQFMPLAWRFLHTHDTETTHSHEEPSLSTLKREKRSRNPPVKKGSDRRTRSIEGSDRRTRSIEGSDRRTRSIAPWVVSDTTQSLFTRAPEKVTSAPPRVQCTREGQSTQYDIDSRKRSPQRADEDKNRNKLKDEINPNWRSNIDLFMEDVAFKDEPKTLVEKGAKLEGEESRPDFLNEFSSAVGGNKDQFKRFANAVNQSHNESYGNNEESLHANKASLGTQRLYDRIKRFAVNQGPWLNTLSHRFRRHLEETFSWKNGSRFHREITPPPEKLEPSSKQRSPSLSSSSSSPPSMIPIRELPVADARSSDDPSSRGERLPPFYDVIGIIGAYTSRLSVVVADVMTLFNLPQISHASTTDILSDKSKYPVFFRTLPADRYQVRALADLLYHFNWTYVSIVFSADAYGTQAEKSLKDLLHQLGICVAQSIELRDNMKASDYDTVIGHLRFSQNARVVALYADIKHIQPLMSAVRRQNAYHEFIWAGSDTTSLVSDMEKENCRHILGSFSVSMNSAPPLRFKEFLQSFILRHKGILKIVPRTDHDIIRSLFAQIPSLKDVLPIISNRTSGGGELYKYTPTFTVTYAIDAVYAYAYAIHNFVNANCPGATGAGVKRCLKGRSILPYLRTVTFPGTTGNVSFNAQGDVVGKIAVSQCQIHNGRAKQVPVATWDTKSFHFHSRLQWPNNSHSAPKSLCAAPCGKREMYTFPEQTCCWKCVRCQPNEKLMRNRTHCLECPMFHWPDDHVPETCHRIKPRFICLRELVPLVLAIVTTLGLMTSLITAFTFYTYRKDRIIRSSSRELSTQMLIGIVVAFLLQYSLLSPPTTMTCYCNQVGFSLTFTLVYGPLLVKTNRIYRIFTAGRKSAALPKWTSSASQLLLASCFILVQVLIVTLSTTLAPPYVTDLMPVKTEKYVIRYCDMPLAGFLPALAFNFLLVLVCTWYAFKTRRLPDNYNESRYIAFCVDTTVLVWISFIPTYFAMNRPYFKTVILAVALLINSIVCLLCLFVPKLYALYVFKQNSHGGQCHNDLGGCGSGGDIRIQLVSNLSMAGLIRSTPSMRESSSGKEHTASSEIEKTDVVTRPAKSARDGRTSGLFSDPDSCQDSHGSGVRLLTSTDVMITQTPEHQALIVSSSASSASDQRAMIASME